MQSGETLASATLSPSLTARFPCSAGVSEFLYFFLGHPS